MRCLAVCKPWRAALNPRAGCPLEHLALHLESSCETPAHIRRQLEWACRTQPCARSLVVCEDCPVCNRGGGVTKSTHLDPRVIGDHVSCELLDYLDNFRCPSWSPETADLLCQLLEGLRLQGEVSVSISCT